MCESVWTAELVEETLVGTARVISATTGRIGPATMKSGLPPSVPEWGDLVSQAGHISRKMTRIGVTQARMSLAEKAVNWLAQYVPDETYRLVLGAYIRSRAARRPFSKAVRANGWVARTAGYRKAIALEQITTGLNRDQIPPAYLFVDEE